MRRWGIPLLTGLAVALGLAMSLGAGPATAAQANEDNIRFYWAIGALAGPESDRKLVPITQDTPLQTGDRFKMFVELQKPAFVYVLYHDAQGEINLLFPYGLGQFIGDYTTAKRYYIPSGDDWFALDAQVGRETFYVLASVRRIGELEKLIERHAAAAPADQAALTVQILAAIGRAQSQYQKFAAVAERPVSIGGSVRGGSPDKRPPDGGGKAHSFDIGTLAKEISAHNFYSGTFTIDHR